MRRPLVLLLALALLGACGNGAPGEAGGTAGASVEASDGPSPSVPGDPLFDVGTVTIDTGEDQITLAVEIARTDAARQKGLMGRAELAPESGMVFVFEDEAPRGFWMKDTLIPLSIAFFDAEGVIVSLLDMEPCEADPCTVYESGAAAMGALEVDAGFFAERGVEEGDTVTLQE